VSDAAWGRLPIAAATLVCMLGGVGGAAGGEPPADERCTLAAGSSHTVVRVADAETIVVDDGSEVRLIGALAARVPSPGAPAPGTTDWPSESQARAALERLLQGRNVELKFGARRGDRYGRLLAHVFVSDGSDKVWVQGYLLAQGFARAYALAGNAACLTEMLEKEREAREGVRGIWGVAAYRVLEATEIGELLRRRNSFEIVEGVVRDVAVTGGRAYVNFGSDWRRDFTAVVPPRLLRGSPETVIRLKALIGKRVRVRGWIERRNGPSVELAALGEIEEIGAGGSGPRGPENAKRPVVAQPGAPDLKD
jgi:endonuclease YncB( thermonuclease family)